MVENLKREVGLRRYTKRTLWVRDLFTWVRMSTGISGKFFNAPLRPRTVDFRLGVAVRAVPSSVAASFCRLVGRGIRSEESKVEEIEHPSRLLF